YLRGSMEKLNGDEMVEAYSKSFDYSKMYFTRSEIDDFIFRFSSALEKFLEKGNLYAAFEMYEDYKQRVQARTEWVYTRLEGDFDFTLEDSFSPDRREVEWPTTDAEREDLW